MASQITEQQSKARHTAKPAQAATRKSPKKSRLPTDPAKAAAKDRKFAEELMAYVKKLYPEMDPLIITDPKAQAEDLVKYLLKHDRIRGILSNFPDRSSNDLVTASLKYATTTEKNKAKALQEVAGLSFTPLTASDHNQGVIFLSHAASSPQELLHTIFEKIGVPTFRELKSDPELIKQFVKFTAIHEIAHLDDRTRSAGHSIAEVLMDGELQSDLVSLLIVRKDALADGKDTQALFKVVKDWRDITAPTTMIYHDNSLAVDIVSDMEPEQLKSMSDKELLDLAKEESENMLTSIRGLVLSTLSQGEIPGKEGQTALDLMSVYGNLSSGTGSNPFDVSAEEARKKIYGDPQLQSALSNQDVMNKILTRFKVMRERKMPLSDTEKEILKYYATN